MKRSRLAPLLVLILAAPAAAISPAGKAEDPPAPRDPFRDPRTALRDDRDRPGLAGLRIAELRLQGLSHVSGEALALVLGSDGLGYVVREGDELRDGRVATIDFARGRVVLIGRAEASDLELRLRTVELLLDRR